MSSRSRQDGWLAVTGAVAVIASFIAGKTARDAILLTTFDITAMPLFVGIAPALSIPLVLVTGRLMVRFGPDRLMPLLNAGSAVMLVGEWAVRDRYPEVSATATFLHLSTFGAVLVSGFWSIVNERFDPRSARRVIGRIGIAATLGGVVGGVIAERVAVHLAPGAILLVVAGVQVLCAVLLHALRGPRRDDPGDADEHALAAVRHVVSSSLLRTLALVIVLDAIAAIALDYVFKAEITLAAGPEGPLRLLAIYYIVTNVLTAVVQLALARPLVERFGVPRGVASLPATLTLLGAVALVMPSLWSVVMARGGEMVTRSSLYRAAYELLYAPLLNEQKRSAKVALDVGAERIGDLIGAQLVVGVLYLWPEPRQVLIGGAVILGSLALLLATRLPRGYTRELERSLRQRSRDSSETPALIYGRQTLSEAGDLTAMSLLNLRAVSADGELGLSSTDLRATVAAPPPGARDPIVTQLTALRSNDPRRVRRALTGAVPSELAGTVVGLLAWDEVAAAANIALRTMAPRATGVLVDALIDPAREFAVRRRLPAILEHGEPTLALWGLWRGLVDERLEVRFRCGRSLARMRARGHAVDHDATAVFEAVKREIASVPKARRDHADLDHDDDELSPQDRLLRDVMQRRSSSSSGLDHIFTLLGFALPPEPLRIALEALHTDNASLRGTALEYLESVLPTDVRVALWPLLEPRADSVRPAAAAARTRDQLLAGLRMSQELIRADLVRQSKVKP